MKTFIIWGLVLLAAVSLTTFALLDIGRVSIRWDVWEIQTSVSLLLALLVVVLLFWVVLVRAWVWLRGLPQAWRRYRQTTRYQKAQATLSKGLIAQEEANWAQAEKHLLQSAKFSDQGVMHYLTAAKMADMQQASARRDQYLAQARAQFPDDQLTIGLVEARLIRPKDPMTALVILAELHRSAPRHKAVLSEYVSVLREQKQADTLRALMPQIKKILGLSRSELAALDEAIGAMRLQQAPDFKALQVIWQSLDSKQKCSPVILGEYVQACLRANEANGLSQLIEKALKVQWDEGLVYLYGRIEFGPAYDRLKTAQAWLKAQPESAVLFLTLGRLACQSQLWGQAHGYFRESLKRQPELETFHAFAQCYEAEGEESQAALVYKQAMLALDKPAS
jgi:HemY protein